MSANTREYDELTQHDKDLIRIGYEVGYELGLRKRAAHDGVFMVSEQQEALFRGAISKRRNEAVEGLVK